MALEDHRVGFVGAGHMGGALIQGAIDSGAIGAAQVWAHDPDPSRMEFLRDTHGVRVTKSNAEVVAQADVVVLAVKPQMMHGVLEEIRGALRASHLIVSIAAGLKTSWIEERLGPDRRVVRVMPNAPALVGAGMSVLCRGSRATPADAALVTELFASVGEVQCVESEGLMDAVTGLSGSGPAYAFVFLEALSDGGVRMGLPRAVANDLAIHTVVGAARLALATGKHFGELKDMVTSPGGTTIQGLQSLEDGGFRAAVMRAVEAATRRSRELGE